jgi:putative ABC transport system permease protein
MTRLAFRSLAARPLRTALTTLAIVLGVALVTGSLTLTDTQGKAADALSTAAYDGTDAVVTARTAFSIDLSNDWTAQRPTVDAAVLDRVRDVPGVEVAVGDVTDQNAQIIGGDGKPLGDGPYFGVGVDASAPGFERVTPFRLTDGRWPARDGEVAIDEKTAEDQGWALGQRIRISSRTGAEAFTVTGVSNFGSVKSLGTATTAVFALDTARRFFDRGDGYDAILVAGPEGAEGAAVRSALGAELGPAASVRTAAADDRFTFDGLSQFISIIRIVLLVFGGVAVLVGALTIVNSLSITLAQRTRELGLLRLVGASRRQILRTVVGEALLIGVIGSVVGLAAGYGLAIGLQSMFASFGLDLPEAGTVFSTGTIVTGLLVGIIVTLLAGLVPALRATRVPPVVALSEADPGSRKVGVLGRAIRPLVSVLARPAERVGGAAGRLARRNALRQPGRTLSTAAALTIGVALVTVLAIVAAGLRDTTTSSLTDRVDATHMVTGQDGWSPVSSGVADTLNRTRGVESVTTVRQDVGNAFGDNERVNAIDGSQIGFEFASGSIPADRLGRDGAIVDEGWADEHGLGVGDRFELLSPAGDRLDLRVRAVETSSIFDGVDLGPITVGREVYDQAFRNDLAVLTAVQAPGATTADLQRALGAFPDADLQTKQAFIDTRMEGIDTLMAIFVVLLALAVIVSLFGIVNALVLATFERRRELGMLAAVGMTRRQIRRMVRHESIVTALLGTSTGIVVGLGGGALLTSLLSEQGLTFVLPVGTLIALVVVAVVAGVLAAVLPARRAARLSPLTALAYE